MQSIKSEQLETPAISKPLVKKMGIDKSEFKEIFDTWFDSLRNFIYYKTGDVQQAEDIVQETFLKVWEKRDTVCIDTVRAYLYTIANHIFINNYQQKKVVLKFINKTKDNKSVESPEFEMEMKEFDAKLQRALSELSDKNREVFLMNRIDDFTYNDIAENLGISVKAVEKRMSKALEHLRKYITGKF